MRRLWIPTIIIAIAVAGYFYFSPYLAVRDLRVALVESDAAGLDEVVDFPQLREGLKAQLNAMMLKETASELDANPFGALAVGLGSKLVDSLIDAIVTPHGLATLSRGDSSQHESLNISSASPRSSTPPKRPFENARLSHDSLSRFSMRVPDDKGGEIRFIFRRTGVKWRLADVLIPLDE